MKKKGKNRLFFGFTVLFIIAVIFSGCSDKVDTISVTSVFIEEGADTDYDPIRINAGIPYPLTAVVMPPNATNKKVSWDSSDEEIATVSADGVVTGLKAGNATITVTTADGGKTDSVGFIVSVRNVTGFSISPTTLTKLTGDDPVTLIATITPADASFTEVTWASSNPAVADVSDEGVVTFTGEGTATITASLTGTTRTATCAVTVYTSGATLTVTFDKNHNDADGWTDADPASKSVTVPDVTLADADETLPTPPTRDLYRFDGWFLNPAGTGTAFTETTAIADANTTVYAKWTYVGGTPYIDDNGDLVHPFPLLTGGTMNPDGSTTWTQGDVTYNFPDDKEGADGWKIFDDYDKFTVYYTSTAAGADVMLANLIPATNGNQEYHLIDEDGNNTSKNVNFVTTPEGGTHIFDIRGANGGRGFNYNKWQEGAAANVKVTKVVFESLTRVTMNFDQSCPDVIGFVPTPIDPMIGVTGLPIRPKIHQSHLSLPTPATIPEGKRFAGWLIGDEPVTAVQVLTTELTGGAASVTLRANWESERSDEVFTVDLTLDNRILPNNTGGAAGNNNATVAEIDGGGGLTVTFANVDQRVLLGFTEDQYANMREASEVTMKITGTAESGLNFRTALAQNTSNWGGSAVPSEQIYTDVANRLRSSGEATLTYNINDAGKVNPFVILFVNANAGGAGATAGVLTLTEIEVTCKF